MRSQEPLKIQNTQALPAETTGREGMLTVLRPIDKRQRLYRL